MQELLAFTPKVYWVVLIVVPFPFIPSYEGNLRLLLDISLQSIPLLRIAPPARPQKPVGSEIALNARLNRRQPLSA